MRKPLSSSVDFKSAKFGDRDTKFILPLRPLKNKPLRILNSVNQNLVNHGRMADHRVITK
jgi:hypothetical protein